MRPRIRYKPSQVVADGKRPRHGLTASQSFRHPMYLFEVQEARNERNEKEDTSLRSEEQPATAAGTLAAQLPGQVAHR